MLLLYEEDGGAQPKLSVIYKNAKILVDTLEAVDRRCEAADGPVSKTEDEWTLEERNAVRQALNNIADQRKGRRR